MRVSSWALIGVLALLVLGTGGFYALAASSASYNNVQISIQTSSNLQYTYTVSVYNTTGSLVAYTQTNFAAAAFELPSGSYLFTATAFNQPSYYPCNLCAQPLKGAASPGIAYPVRYNPTAEYGFAMQQVNGPIGLTIKTQNTTLIPTTQVTIKATFFNGTAASNAYVSAFVVGQSYYWWGYGTKISMWNQTNKAGIATLTVPQVPVEVTAGLSVPISLPKSVTTVTTTVGGQKINVTVYWQPSYAYLTGSALILPPQNSATIVLTYQQPNYYYPMAYGASSAPGGIAYSGSGVSAPPGILSNPGQTSGSQSGVTQTSTVQAQNGPAAKISPFAVPTDSGSAQTTTTQGSQPSTSHQAPAGSNDSTGNGSMLLLGGAAVVAAAVAIAGLVAFSARGKK